MSKKKPIPPLSKPNQHILHIHRPASQNQQAYLASIRSKQLTVCSGPAGTGKTLLAVQEAVQLLRNSKIEKIILVRPLVDCGEAIGFFPGSEKEKATPYARSMIGKLNRLLGESEANQLQANGSIEIATLQTMRGDEFVSGSFVILDEAQNTTCRQMKMFLTRIATGSRVVVNGDDDQVDICEPSGFLHLIDNVRSSHLIGFVRMSEADIMRAEIVREILTQW